MAKKETKKQEAKEVSSQSIAELTINPDGTFIIRGQAKIIGEHGTYKDKDGQTRTSDSVKLISVGRGMFGINVSNATIAGTHGRVNLALRVNLAKDQWQKDSDLVVTG